jgi:hypothetical protein
MGRFTRNRREESKEVKPANPDMDSIEVGGSFQCQVCDEVTFTAMYLPPVKELGWKCPSGHISTIKDFNL